MPLCLLIHPSRLAESLALPSGSLVWSVANLRATIEFQECPTWGHLLDTRSDESSRGCCGQDPNPDPGPGARERLGILHPDSVAFPDL